MFCSVYLFVRCVSQRSLPGLSQSLQPYLFLRQPYSGDRAIPFRRAGQEIPVTFWSRVSRARLLDFMTTY